MVAYFVRRIIGGFAQLLMVLLIIFYIVIEFPGGKPQMMPCPHCPFPPTKEAIRFIEKNYFVGKPWPLNFVGWMFDPDEQITSQSYDLQGNPLPPIQKGVDITIGNLQIKGSGVLTGDLGVSVNFDQGTPVTDMFGRGIGEMFAFLISLVVVLMAIATAQRMGRPQPYRLSATPTALTLADWWHLHAESPPGVIIRRQWG
jgi:hypothetical protein